MRRTFWVGVGYTIGISSSVWVQRRVRRTVERYTPEQIRQDIAAKGREMAYRAQDVVIDLRDAAQEGAAAMRDEERDLRARFTPVPDPHQHRPTRRHH